MSLAGSFLFTKQSCNSDNIQQNNVSGKLGGNRSPCRVHSSSGVIRSIRQYSFINIV